MALTLAKSRARPFGAAVNWLAEHGELLAVSGAIGLGTAARAICVAASDFPLVDGGMFYTMVRDLQQAGFSLPWFTSYNGGQIPFTYPPFMFYVAGAAAQLTHLGVLDILRLVPLVASCLCVPAFWLLARTVLPSCTAAVLATLVFALIPQDYIWLVMGGGLTRAPGLLFAILALQQLHRLYSTGRWRFAATSGTLAGLTLLSHLETASFLALSGGYFFLAIGRSGRGAMRSLTAASVATAVSSVWWAPMFIRHGISPLLSSFMSGDAIPAGMNAFSAAGLRLGLFAWHTSEPGLPILGMLGLAAAIRACYHRQFFLASWLVVTVLFEPRAWGTFDALPLALLAGNLLSEGFSCLRRSLPAAGTALLVPGLLVGYSAVGIFAGSAPPYSELRLLAPLTSADREAMTAAQTLTTATDTFLVATDRTWQADAVSEWFPALTQRRSLTTVQGSEWLPHSEFTSRVGASRRMAMCAQADSQCPEGLGLRFDYLYVPKDEDACCGPLMESLRKDANYQEIYNGPGAAIFERN